MKSVAIASGLLALSGTLAAAQYKDPPAYNPAIHRYAEHRHSTCQAKALRLATYEGDRARGVRLASAEERTVRRLNIDLDKSCGGFRLGARR